MHSIHYSSRGSLHIMRLVKKKDGMCIKNKFILDNLFYCI